MKLIMTSAITAAAVCFLLSGSAQAKTKIVVTYPYIESLVKEIAKDTVDVSVLAKGDEDPHFVVPRPSFIGRMRQADLLTQNSVTIDGVDQQLENMLARYTAMLEFSPTEFSRFRLQYAFDRSRYFDNVRRDVHEVLLQVNIAVGPHGAHSF